MAENPIIRRNEEKTNSIVARVMAWCIPFFLLIIVLRALGLFLTPIEQYVPPFLCATVLLFLPTFLLYLNKTGPWFKYLIVGAAIGCGHGPLLQLLGTWPVNRDPLALPGDHRLFLCLTHLDRLLQPGVGYHHGYRFRPGDAEPAPILHGIRHRP